MLQVCLNGARRPFEGVPVTPAQLAEQAAAAVAAGAESVHVHPRADGGAETLDGATVLIDPMSVEYMAGSEIDFVDDLIGASFKVKNPNATASCGCGTSFSL